MSGDNSCGQKKNKLMCVGMITEPMALCISKPIQVPPEGGS